MVRSSTVSGVRVRSGKIQIDFYYKDVRCRENLSLDPTPRNIKYAAQLRAAILYDIESGEFNYAKYFPNSLKCKLFRSAKDVQFNDLCDEQYAIYQRREQNGMMSISTLNGYRKIMFGTLKPIFGDLLISEITASKIKEWLYSLDCSAKTVRNLLIPMARILKTASLNGLIKISPLENMDLDEIIKDISTPKKEVINPFNNEEKEILINSASGQFKNLVQFGFWSGLRTGELIALRWSDIDYVNNVITVCHNIVCGKEKPPKTKSGIRNVLILPQAMEALKNQEQHTKQYNDFVFHAPDKNQRWQNDQVIRQHWTKLFMGSNIKYRYPYQMRHTYASTLLMAGENIAWIATQLGHVNTEMVIKNYGKFIPDNNVVGGYKLKGTY